MSASWEVRAGDCRELMRAMPEASVQVAVTSPPYFGLRDYGLSASVWGGEGGCEHDWDEEVVHGEMRRGLGLADSAASTRGGAKKVRETPDITVSRATCAICGAWRGTLGNEPTLELYVEHLVAVFRDLRRVLRPDGVVWLNLGDSYANPGHYKGNPGAHGNIGRPRYTDHEDALHRQEKVGEGLKNKNLMLVPARVALALQADGWFLRSEVIWSKPNPLPESVTDRPTKAHEQLYLLSRSERYFYDAHAIREAHRPDSVERVRRGWHRNGHKWEEGPGAQTIANEPPSLNPAGRNRRSVWEVPEELLTQFLRFLEAAELERPDVWEVATVPFKGSHFAVFPPELVEPCLAAGASERGACPRCGTPWHRAVRRSRKLDGEELEESWGDATGRGSPGADGVGHWRVQTDSSTLGWFPMCACGAPEGVLPGDLEPIHTPTGGRAGEDPSRRTGRAGLNRPRGEGEGVRTITRYQQRRYAEQMRAWPSAHRVGLEDMTSPDAFAHYIRTDRAGARPLPPDLLELLIEKGALERVDPPSWAPPEPVPCVALDPFCGAGTTGVVASRLGRAFVGLELSEEYAELARERIRDDAPLLNIPAEA